MYQGPGKMFQSRHILLPFILNDVTTIFSINYYSIFYKYFLIVVDEPWT